MQVSANSLKKGNIIIHEQQLYTIIKNPEHVKPGKGPAYVQLEMKNIKTSAKTKLRLSATQSVERAHVETKEFNFLYQSTDELFLMDIESYDQINLDKNLFSSETLTFLQENMIVNIEFFEDMPIELILPQNVELTVEETEPFIKGATAAPSYKPAKLSNGITIKVPGYITTGEKILVKTEDASFVERVKT